MSDYISFDIQAKIMINLPSKSLIQFRSVSKAWKSLIDSTEFIADHHRNTHQRHNYLLVRDSEHKYVSVLDDDTFPQHKLSLTLPMSARKPRIVGSSQGLFCLYGKNVGTLRYSGTKTAAIWNPTIRKLVDIGQLPYVNKNIFQVIVGFGVCPRTLNPKILNVSVPWVSTDTTWQVEIFRLSLGAWTSLPTNLPPGISLIGNQVAIDRFIYWPAARVSVNLLEFDVIMSFDLTSEEFTYVDLPDVLAPNLADEWNIYKLKESLVVLQMYYDGADYDVWIMEDGVRKSFTKIYTIKCHKDDGITCVLEFRNSGEPIVSISDDYEPCEAADYLPDPNHLYVYKPNSTEFSHIGISSKVSTFLVSSYAETLLLLDH